MVLPRLLRPLFAPLSSMAFFVRFPLACVHGLALFAAGGVIAVCAVLSALVAVALKLYAANGERRLAFWLHR
jgi:hypothetical protein